jgi:hypothetical protein
MYCMIKIIENAYKNLGYESDYGYSLISNEYMHATYFLRDLGYHI